MKNIEDEDENVETLREENTRAEELNISNETLISSENSNANSFLTANDESENPENLSLINPSRFNTLKFAVTNARSPAPKFDSLIVNFDELELDFMTVSETWHKVGDKKTREIYNGAGLGIIERPRSARGGGVAIVFNETRVQLKEAFSFSGRFEAVCGVGKWLVNNRKLLIISAYLPPKMDAAAVRDFVEEIRSRLEKAAIELENHILVLGGDTNKKNIANAFLDFPHISQVIRAPTRGRAVLDQCFTNLSQTQTSIHLPLFDPTGSQSDHSVCLIEAKLPRRHFFKKTEFYTRKITPAGEAKFGSLLAVQDWAILENKTSDEAVMILDAKLQEWQELCFPLRKHTVRSTDKPWITKRIRRLIRRRKRAFKSRGKNSDQYWEKARYTEVQIRENRIRFFDKIKSNIVRDKNVRQYYRAIKLLESDETPARWHISSLFPGSSDKQIAEESAHFFNAISSEFQPIGPPSTEAPSMIPPTTNEIRLRILKMKKPKTSVRGDIDCRLLAQNAALLATPLKIIFNQIYESKSWPSLWKQETVSLLPKNKSPSSLAQLRNISCTPFFSKLLETFVLDGLKSTITLSDSQFGGKKGQGIDHMLIETWDEIHRGLEAGATAMNIMAVDYEKAFNRLDHGKCLDALRELGGQEGYIALVNAFLFDRKMTVKIGSDYSDPLPVNGGSPQGSILGCFLFCATINKLLAVKPTTTAPISDQSDSESVASLSPVRPPIQSDDSSDEDVATFFRWFRPRQINDTIESQHLNNSAARNLLEIDSRMEDPAVMGYIDDFNVIERLDERLKVTHHTTNRTQSSLHAPLSDNIFATLGELSGDLGMKINPTKTQVLCISSAANMDTNSFIRVEGRKIHGGKELKVLGFWFNNSPSVGLHVEKMLAKTRARLWSLRKLKANGLAENDLHKTYTTYIRPILDYAVPTYHSQLTAEQASEIERLQAVAMKIVYGPLVAYHTVIDQGLIEMHSTRRETLFKKFAMKASQNPTFANKWFPENPPPEYNLRQHEKYHLPASRTERYRKSPLQAMRAALNRIHVTP